MARFFATLFAAGVVAFGLSLQPLRAGDVIWGHFGTAQGLSANETVGMTPYLQDALGPLYDTPPLEINPFDQGLALPPVGSMIPGEIAVDIIVEAWNWMTSSTEWDQYFPFTRKDILYPETSSLYTITVYKPCLSYPCSLCGDRTPGQMGGSWGSTLYQHQTWAEATTIAVAAGQAFFPWYDDGMGPNWNYPQHCPAYPVKE